MREITARLTPGLSKHYGNIPLHKADPFIVSRFTDLVTIVSQLSIVNKDYVLLYRGQMVDYKNKSGSSTFYPTIYRPEIGKEYLWTNEVNRRFEVLKQCGRLLVESLDAYKMRDISHIRDRELVRWSILQHYQVCGTPLFDVTQSLSIACSFATRANNLTHGYVYIFGLPYPANRITRDSEHDIILIRLLGVTPPTARKPLYQEGYLVATDEIRDIYSRKSDLDFKRRLVAKFKIPTAKIFWDGGFSQHPRSVLDPSDEIGYICDGIKEQIYEPIVVGDLKVFFELAIEIEKRITQMDSKGGSTILDHISNLDIWGFTDKGIQAGKDVFDFRDKAIKSRVPLSDTWVRSEIKKARAILINLQQLIDRQ